MNFKNTVKKYNYFNIIIYLYLFWKIYTYTFNTFKFIIIYYLLLYAFLNKSKINGS